MKPQGAPSYDLTAVVRRPYLDLPDATLAADLEIRAHPEAVLRLMEAEIDERYVPPRRSA